MTGDIPAICIHKINNGAVSQRLGTALSAQINAGSSPVGPE